MVIQANLISSVSNEDIMTIFRSHEISQLMDISNKYDIWKDVSDENLKLNHLFSRSHFSPFFSAEQHLRITNNMFPVSEYRDIWEEIVKGPVQEMEDDSADWVLVDEAETTPAPSRSGWFSYLLPTYLSGNAT